MFCQTERLGVTIGASHIFIGWNGSQVVALIVSLKINAEKAHTCANLYTGEYDTVTDIQNECASMKFEEIDM